MHPRPAPGRCRLAPCRDAGDGRRCRRNPTPTMSSAVAMVKKTCARAQRRRSPTEKRADHRAACLPQAAATVVPASSCGRRRRSRSATSWPVSRALQQRSSLGTMRAARRDPRSGWIVDFANELAHSALSGSSSPHRDCGTAGRGQRPSGRSRAATRARAKARVGLTVTVTAALRDLRPPSGTHPRWRGHTPGHEPPEALSWRDRALNRRRHVKGGQCGGAAASVSCASHPFIRIKGCKPPEAHFRSAPTMRAA
jgi:hypothetical protein